VRLSEVGTEFFRIISRHSKADAMAYQSHNVVCLRVPKEHKYWDKII